MSDPTLDTFAHHYKLDRAGMARIFGELEAAIMEVLWELGEGTVSSVSVRLASDAQYTTVQTVMTRLAEKGILTRTLLAPGGAYLYRPSEQRDVFLSRITRVLVSSLLTDFGEAAIAGLVAAVDVIPPDQLAELVKLIEERRGPVVNR